MVRSRPKEVTKETVKKKFEENGIIMTTAKVRVKLYNYIRIADDKKVKAIYTMLENDITEENKWWQDNAFTKELDRRYSAWEAGKEKGYTPEEVDAAIAQLKKKSRGK